MSGGHYVDAWRSLSGKLGNITDSLSCRQRLGVEGRREKGSEAGVLFLFWRFEMEWEPLDFKF